MGDALSQIRTRGASTPQTEQADPRQVQNAAGGYVFQVGPAARIQRFLTLGTDGGTYYASERELTKDAAGAVLEAAQRDGTGLVKQIVEVSQAGRAPRSDPALFALAAASGLADDAGRHAAFGALPEVARTGGHLVNWARYREQFGGWGRGACRAVADWYLAKDPQEVAYQVLKYKQREGWSHRDLLELARPGKHGMHREISPAHAALFGYVRGKKDFALAELPLVQVALTAHATRSVKEWVRLIVANRSLSWEMLPSEALKHSEVWEALLLAGNLPLEALLRNLGRMTRLGVYKQMNDATQYAALRLTDPAQLAKARMHPIKMLVALRTYASGHGARSEATWSPVGQLVDALDGGFYAAFGAVEPSGKRHVLGIDVSRSMSDPVSGLPLQCREAAAAMAMATAHTEPACAIMGFTGTFVDLGITGRQRLDDAIGRAYRADWQHTDCSLPMLWALQNGIGVDQFVVYTDNETYYGQMHPHQALERYRQATGIPARLSVVSMTATGTSIADPADPGMLDVAGFDARVPTLLADFARGDI